MGFFSKTNNADARKNAIDNMLSEVEERLSDSDIDGYISWGTQIDLPSVLSARNNEHFDFIKTGPYSDDFGNKIDNCYMGFRGTVMHEVDSIGDCSYIQFHPFALIQYYVEDSFIGEIFKIPCKILFIKVLDCCFEYETGFVLSESEMNIVTYLIEKRNALVTHFLEKAYIEISSILSRLKNDDRFLEIISNFVDKLPDSLFMNPSSYFEYRRQTLDVCYVNYFLTRGGISEFEVTDLSLPEVNFDELKTSTNYLCEYLKSEWNIPNGCVHSVAFCFVRNEVIRRYQKKAEEVYGIHRIRDNENKGEYISDCFATQKVFPEDNYAKVVLAWSLVDKENFDVPFYEDFFENFDVINAIASEYKEKSKECSFMSSLLKRKTEETNIYQAKVNIDDVDLMTGLEFEELIAHIFEKMGYAVSLTKGSNDQGIDIIAKKDNLSIGIQAKCYGSSVGNSAIQEAVAGIAYYNLNKAMVITNNEFTPAAIDLAQANNVVLWNRTVLKEKLRVLER